MKLDRWRIVVLVGMLLVVSIPAAAEEPLTIVSPTTYKAGLEVRDAVKAQCGLLEKVPAYIEEFARKNGPVTLATTTKGAKGKTLVVEIEEIREAGTMGPKSLTIKGELRSGGKLVGTIQARRSSMGGPLGMFGGACGILHRCAKALGKDLAGWIENPAMNVEMTN
jgi:hypothetical protein